MCAAMARPTVGSSRLTLENMDRDSLGLHKINKRSTPNVASSWVVSTPSGRVFWYTVPASVFSKVGCTFGDSSDDLELDPSKQEALAAFYTFIFAANALSSVTILCELVPNADDLSEIAAYLFIVIDHKSSHETDEDSSDDDDGIDKTNTEKRPKPVTFGAAFLSITMTKPYAGNTALSKLALQRLRQTARPLALLSFKSFVAGYHDPAAACVNISLMAQPNMDTVLRAQNVFSLRNSLRALERANAPTNFWLNVDDVAKHRLVLSAETEHPLTTTVKFYNGRNTYVYDSQMLAPPTFVKLPRPDRDMEARTLRDVARSAASHDGYVERSRITRFTPVTKKCRQLLAAERAAVQMALPGKPLNDAFQKLWKKGDVLLNDVIESSMAASMTSGVSEAQFAHLKWMRDNYGAADYDIPNGLSEVCAKISPTSNFMLWFMQNMEGNLYVYSDHDCVLQLFIILPGHALPFEPGGVAPSACLSGPPCTHKTFSLDMVNEIFVPGACLLRGSSSAKAFTADPLSFHGRVILWDELELWMQNGAPKDEGSQSQLETFKKNCTPPAELVTVTCVMADDPVLGRIRTNIINIHEEFGWAVLQATNYAGQKNPAIASRVDERPMLPGKRPNGHSLSEVIAHSNETSKTAAFVNSHATFIRTCRYFLVFHNLVGMTMGAGILPQMKMINFNFVLHRLQKQLKFNNIPALQPRTIERMRNSVVTVTILDCWLKLYVHAPGPYAKRPGVPAVPPKPEHIPRWAQLLATDDLECAFQGISTYWHSIHSETLTPLRVAGALWHFVCSGSCPSSEFSSCEGAVAVGEMVANQRGELFHGAPAGTVRVRCVDDAAVRQLLDDDDSSPAPAAPSCAVRVLKTASIFLTAALQLRSLDPPHSRTLFDKARATLELLEGVNPDVINDLMPVLSSSDQTNQCNADGEAEMDGAGLAVAAIKAEVETALNNCDETCKNCAGPDCKVTVFCSNYLAVLGSLGNLAVRLKQYWDKNDAHLGQAVSIDNIHNILVDMEKNNKTDDVDVDFVYLQPDRSSHIGATDVRVLLPQRRMGKESRRAVSSPRGPRGVVTVLSVGSLLQGLPSSSLSALSITDMLSGCLTQHSFSHLPEGGDVLLPVRQNEELPELPRRLKVAPTQEVAAPIITRAVPIPFTIHMAGLDPSACGPAVEVDDVGTSLQAAVETCTTLGIQVENPEDEEGWDEWEEEVKRRGHASEVVVPSIWRANGVTTPWSTIFGRYLGQKKAQAPSRARTADAAELAVPTSTRLRRQCTDSAVGAAGMDFSW